MPPKGGVLIGDSNPSLERKKNDYNVMVLAKHPLVNLLTTHEQHKEHHFKPNRKENSGFARK